MIKGSYEHTNLKRAVLMLLDWTYGEGRIRKIRAALERFPAPTSFQQSLLPLNAIMTVARTNYAAAEQIVDLCERKRVWLHEKEQKLTPSLLRVRGHRANNTRLYRERLFTALEAFETHAGRKLTKEEADAALAYCKDMWAKRGKKIADENRHVMWQEVKKLMSQDATEHAEKLLMSAKLKRDMKFFNYAVNKGKELLKKRKT